MTPEKHCKRCSKCDKKYPETLEYFSAQKAGKNGLKAICKECAKTERRAYMATDEGKRKNRESSAKWKRKNPEKSLEISRKNYRINGEKQNALKREKYKNDPEYREQKKEAERRYQESGERYRINHKPENMESARIRSRIRRSIPEKREHDAKRMEVWREVNREINREKDAQRRRGLEDSYVAYVMRKKRRDLSPEVLQTRRIIIELKRELRKNNVKIR